MLGTRPRISNFTRAKEEGGPARRPCKDRQSTHRARGRPSGRTVGTHRAAASPRSGRLTPPRTRAGGEWKQADGNGPPLVPGPPPVPRWDCEAPRRGRGPSFRHRSVWERPRVFRSPRPPSRWGGACVSNPPHLRSQPPRPRTRSLARSHTRAHTRVPLPSSPKSGRMESFYSAWYFYVFRSPFRSISRSRTPFHRRRHKKSRRVHCNTPSVLESKVLVRF